MPDYSKYADEELARKIKQKKGLLAFKTPEVESEFSGLSPDVRNIISKAPSAITVTSGKRSLGENISAGGVPTSKHLTGRAVDIRKDEMSSDTMNYLSKSGAKVIDEGDHIHAEFPEVKTMPKYAYTDEELRAKIEAKKAELAQPKGKSIYKQQGITDLGRGNPLLGLATGLGRAVPGSDIASAVVGTMIEQAKAPFTTGEPVKPIEEFKKQYKMAKRVGKEVEEASPIASTIGRGISGAAQTAVGMGLGGTPAGLLAKAGKAALVSPAVGQAGRGFEFDPTMTAIETLAGPAGEVLTAGMQAGAKLLQKPAQKLGARILNSIFKTPKAEIKAGKDIGKEIYERGIGAKTRGGYAKMAEKALESGEKQLQEKLTKVISPVKTETITKEIEGLKKIYEGIPDVGPELESIDTAVADVVKNHPDTIPATKANELKRKIYQLIGSKAYKGQPVLGAKTEAKKATARGLKKGIEAAAEETTPGLGKTVRDINKELGFHGRMKDYLSDIEAGSQGKNLVKLLPFLMAGAGGGLGAYRGDSETGIAGAALPLLLGTPYGKSLSVSAMRQLLESASKGAAPRYLTPFAERYFESNR